MNLIIIVVLLIIIGIFLNRKRFIEGYTECIKQRASSMNNLYYNQKFMELLNAPPIELANKAYKLNIPLKDIKYDLNNNKNDLIFKVLNKGNFVFKTKDSKTKESKTKDSKTTESKTTESKTKTPKKEKRKAYRRRNIVGYNPRVEKLHYF